MTFRFSLQKLLNLKEKEAEHYKLLIKNKRLALIELKKVLETERINYFKDRDELNTLLKNCNLVKVPSYESSLELRKKRMIEILENIKTLEMDISFLQQSLIQTKRKVKLYEKLKEKKLNEYLQEENLKEKNAFDEFSQIKHFFKCHS